MNVLNNSIGRILNVGYSIAKANKWQGAGELVWEKLWGLKETISYSIWTFDCVLM